MYSKPNAIISKNDHNKFYIVINPLQKCSLSLKNICYAKDLKDNYDSTSTQANSRKESVSNNNNNNNNIN